MSIHSVYLFATAGEVAYLPTTLPYVKKCLHAEVDGYHVLGPREEKLQRAAYDMGSKFEVINGDFTWAKVVEVLERDEYGERFVLWFSHCLPIKPWNPGKGQEIRFYGQGYGLALPRELATPLLAGLTGPVTCDSLVPLMAQGEVTQPHLRILTPGLLRSWDQNLGLGGKMFHDGVLFQDERLTI